MRTTKQCQKLIFDIAMRVGVSPKLIATRLLSDDDKKDMLNSSITDEQLEAHVRVWHENRMPNYSEGDTEPLKLY